ncbi:MAG: glycosyltransferase family 39 protein [Armatimonadota bacterium]
MLCLLIAAIAGRWLIGRRAATESRDLVWRPPLVWALVALAALLPYLGSVRNGFVSDDFGLAWIARDSRTAAEAMRSTGLIGFYRPVTMFVWWLGDRLWHGAPLGYHLLAIALHIANSLLVFALGRRLIGSRYGALAAALLFAVHPLHVEPLCWPAAISDLLCAGFALASLLALTVYLASATRSTRTIALCAALISFALALFSKEVALALPGAAVLIGALGARPRRRDISVSVAGYLIVLSACLGWRMHVLGGLGGYALPLSFWNTAFPSGPLLLMGDFLFPVHTTLFARLGAIGWWVVLLAMAAFVLWLLSGLDRVPARRLCLWLGFVFVLAVPSWTFRWQPSASLEWTRFAYLPTIGLAWLFGDVCAGRGLGWRRSGATIALVLIGCSLLTIWYVTPWTQAGRLAGKAVSAGLAFIRGHGGAQPLRGLYVQNLPQAYQGAPVLANCYPQAMDLAIGKQVPVRVVTAAPRSNGVHPDVMPHWVLKRGEFLISFDASAGAMRTIRSGPPPGRRAPSEGQP